MPKPHRFLLLFLLLAAAGLVWMELVKPPGVAIVRFELETSVKEAGSLLGEFDGETWGRMRATYERDALFIVGYAGFFAAAGAGVRRSRPRLGWAIVALALAVGAFDALENVYGLKVLAADLGPGSVPLLRNMAFWSHLKWFSLGPLALALAGADLARKGTLWAYAAAALFAAAGVLLAASWAAPSVLFTPWPMALLAGGMIAHTVAAFRRS